MNLEGHEVKECSLHLEKKGKSGEKKDCNLKLVLKFCTRILDFHYFTTEWVALLVSSFFTASYGYTQEKYPAAFWKYKCHV